MLGLKRTKSGSQNDLKKVLGDFELPTIPAVVTAAIDKISAPDCDMSEVGDIVATDPGLSARLLSIVNSAAYAPRNPIAGVNQAVMMLGRNHLESLLISLAASSAAASGAAPKFDMQEFWMTAAWRATTAAAFAERFDRGRRTENFTAALLEDIAVPILLRCQPKYANVLAEWKAGAGELVDLEQAAFGWTHTVVAGWMFEEWGFPDALRDAVTEAGQPEETEVDYPIVQVVSALANPGDFDEVVGEVAERLSTLFGTAFDEAVALIEKAHSEAAHIAQTLS